MRAVIPILLATLLAPAPALAGGLFTPDTGIVGFARGGANVARADDLVSGLYYNPAGLWQIDGLSVQGGLHLLRTDVHFTRSGGEGIYNVDEDGNVIEGSLDDPFPRTDKLPHTRPIPEGGFAFGFRNPDLTIALGLYAPIAPIQSYPRYGPGRYRVTEQELIQGNISLSAGWRICDWLAVGASFQILLMELNEQFAGSSDFLAANTGVLTEDPQWDILVSFSADNIRPHFNVGVMAMPTPWLRVAASFEPAYRFNGTGRAELSGTLGERYYAELPDVVADKVGREVVVVSGVDEEVDLTVGLPGRIRVGASVQPAPQFEIELDFNLELWRGSGDVTASNIDIPLEHVGDDVDGPVPLADYLEGRSLCTIVDCSTASAYTGETDDNTLAVPADFSTTWSVRLGGEVTPIPMLGVRFGGLYEAPATSPENQGLTMLDGHKVLLGTGLAVRPGAGQEHGPLLELHVSYAHIFYIEREVGSDVSRGRTKVLEGVPSNQIDAGTYGGYANMFGVNLAAHFGAMAQRSKALKAAREDGGG